MTYQFLDETKFGPFLDQVLQADPALNRPKTLAQAFLDLGYWFKSMTRDYEIRENQLKEFPILQTAAPTTEQWHSALILQSLVINNWARTVPASDPDLPPFLYRDHPVSAFSVSKFKTVPSDLRIKPPSSGKRAVLSWTTLDLKSNPDHPDLRNVRAVRPDSVSSLILQTPRPVYVPRVVWTPRGFLVLTDILSYLKKRAKSDEHPDLPKLMMAVRSAIFRSKNYRREAEVLLSLHGPQGEPTGLTATLVSIHNKGNRV